MANDDNTLLSKSREILDILNKIDFSQLDADELIQFINDSENIDNRSKKTFTNLINLQGSIGLKNLFQSIVDIESSDYYRNLYDAENMSISGYVKGFLYAIDRDNYNGYAEELFLEELKKPEYKGKTLQELADECELDENGMPAENSLFMQVLENTRQAMELRKAQAADLSISVKGKKPTALEFPLTKYHDDLFTNLFKESADKSAIPGQLAFLNIGLSAESRTDKKERTIFYSILFSNFEDTKAVKALDDYDRRVYDAVSTLYNAGNNIFSLNQIYKQMCGNDKTCNAKGTQKAKIKASLFKLSRAWIEIDQSQDYAPYIKESAGKIGVTYSGQLLYFDTLACSVNGRHTDDAIRILQEPILFRLAKDRNQIATIPNEMLGVAKSLTPDYLAVENYLISRLARMQNKKTKSSDHILYSAIYERVGAEKKDKMKRKRAIDNAFIILESYQKKGLIQGYKADKNNKGEPIIKVTF